MQDSSLREREYNLPKYKLYLYLRSPPENTFLTSGAEKSIFEENVFLTPEVCSFDPADIQAIRQFMFVRLFSTRKRTV